VKVKDAKRQAEYYRARAMKLERELNASHQRPLPPPPPPPVVTHGSSTMNEATPPPPPPLEGLAETRPISEAMERSVERDQYEDQEEQPLDHSAKVSTHHHSMSTNTADTLKNKVHKKHPGGWWDRMHGRHAGQMERRETMRLEAEEKRKQQEVIPFSLF
jgi:hypothetical protein